VSTMHTADHYADHIYKVHRFHPLRNGVQNCHYAAGASYTGAAGVAF
jgi:hypothetical protein